MKKTIKTLGQLAEGNFSDWVQIDRDDEFGKILQNLKSVQIRLGYDVNETKVTAARTKRFADALDNIHGNVMLVDNDNTIIFVNKAFAALIEKAGKGLSSVIPELGVGDVSGKNLNMFFVDAAFKNSFTNPVQAPIKLETQIGEVPVRIHANPIVDQEGRNLGTVLEWTDFSRVSCGAGCPTNCDICTAR